ncbi:type II toxin-antitoxin system RelE family toxin [Dysosmobacter sp.]|uniref:type II toxin-antitoxin system RelE family toxin n=1 Tax=Dysosmobacter sp. TaxID=2591382 RepID=UPI002A9A5FAD|nr:type II toxin-antitoxin system RelE/ParE family toxin [Dysosmobacter sp.]MDY5510093.1 type II toxin-antitoxin system RelE/ParE family toxin [Dysosmobacter sp.]
MELRLQKQPIKYLESVDQPTRNKLYRALDKLKNLDGDIVKLKGYDNLYRFKIQHYRILFSVDREGNIIIVSAINTRTNTKY